MSRAQLTQFIIQQTIIHPANKSLRIAGELHG